MMTAFVYELVISMISFKRGSNRPSPGVTITGLPYTIFTISG